MVCEKPISGILIIMTISNLQLSLLIIRALEILVYLLIIFLAFRRRSGWISAPVFLGAFSLVALVFQIVRALAEFGLLPGLNDVLRHQLDYYEAVVLSMLLYQTLRIFLLNSKNLIALGVGLAWTIVLVILQNFLLTFLSWVVFTGLSVVLSVQTLVKTRQPLHRNRLVFVFPVLALMIANDVFVFYRSEPQDSFVRLGGAALLAYVVLRHHIPDMRDLTRQFLIYILSTLLTMVVYIVGFLIANAIFSDVPGYEPIFAGAGLAVIISLI